MKLFFLSCSLFLFSCGTGPVPPHAKNSADETQDTIATAVPESAKVSATDTSKNATIAPATKTDPLVEAGRKIFYNKRFGAEAGVACASCHEDGTPRTADGMIRAGHSIAGANLRTSAWNNEFTGETLLRTAHGAGKCAAIFEKRGNGNPLTALSVSEAKALEAYYTANAKGNEPKQLVIAWISKPPTEEHPEYDDKALRTSTKTILALAPDESHGAKLFARACAGCHTTSEEAKVGPGLKKRGGKEDVVANTVRLGQLSMPFFTRDRLSDQDVRDIAAWLKAEVKK